MRYLNLPLLLLFFFLCGSSAWAALPPLDSQEQRNESSEVVVGTVMNVRSKLEDVGNGKDRVYRVSFRVEGVEKGGLRSGVLITALFRQTAQRPDGWAGPQGQNVALTEDLKARLFLREADHEFWLLSPNGWETWEP